MKISDLYEIFLKHPIISIDSRKPENNSIFFAISGENFDGNTFAEKALKNGCKYAIIDKPEYNIDERTILVKNTLETLQDLAKLHRIKKNIPVIAITGTNGKTTTKELIAKVLSTKYNVLYTKGNLNNHIGVPLTILKIKNEELAVIEMGANHIGEIDFLCNIALPNYGIITNIGKAHLEGFKDVDGIIKTKTELYRFLEKTNGIIFINSENAILSEKSAPLKLKKILYGSHIDSNIKGEIVKSNLFLNLNIFDNKASVSIESNLIGNYNFENILTAASIGKHFKIPLINIKEAIEEFYPDNNRSQLTKTSKNKLIIDAYNANPTSMKMAISNFSEIIADDKLLILGDMLELGETAKLEHQNIIDQITNYKFKNVILIGENFKEVATNNMKIYNNINDLINDHHLELIKDHIILIKGSRGIQLEKISQFL